MNFAVNFPERLSKLVVIDVAPIVHGPTKIRGIHTSLQGLDLKQIHSLDDAHMLLSPSVPVRYSPFPSEICLFYNRRSHNFYPFCLQYLCEFSLNFCVPFQPHLFLLCLYSKRTCTALTTKFHEAFSASHNFSNLPLVQVFAEFFVTEFILRPRNLGMEMADSITHL